MLYAAEEQVVHHMTLVQSLALETGPRPVGGTRRETAALHGVLEVGVCGEDLEHLLGVRLPVRGAARRRPARGGSRPGPGTLADQAALVVPLLRARGRGSRRSPAGESGASISREDDRVAVGHPDVGIRLVHETQQVALAGGVDVRARGCWCPSAAATPRGGLAHAEADLQDDGTGVLGTAGEVDDPLPVDVQPPHRGQAAAVRPPARRSPGCAGAGNPDPPLEVRPGGIGLRPVRETGLAPGAGVAGGRRRHGARARGRPSSAAGRRASEALRKSDTVPSILRGRSSMASALCPTSRPIGSAAAAGDGAFRTCTAWAPSLDQEVVHQRAVRQDRLPPALLRAPPPGPPPSPRGAACVRPW